MSTTSTTTSTIPGRTSQEENIMRLLQQLTGDASGQLGDLGGLAG